jgi:hypothetical protein
MRKLTLLLILVLLAISNIFSQSRPSVFVKWAPASLAVGKVTVGSEINFTRKSSIDVMIGIPAPKTQTIQYDDKESDIESKAFSALVGYRYYLGKRSARGVYLEPYAKYLRHEASGILEGDLDDRLTRMDTRTKYEAFGVGAQMGVQFMLFRRVSIDFYFLGFEANSAKFHTRSKDVANSLPWTFIQAEEAQDDIEDAIEDIPYLQEKVSVTVNQANKSVDTDFKGFLPGLRFGASIGFRF